MGTSDTALTAHLVLKDDHVVLNTNKICHDLHHEFEISHSTLQVENMLDKENCRLEPAAVI